MNTFKPAAFALFTLTMLAGCGTAPAPTTPMAAQMNQPIAAAGAFSERDYQEMKPTALEKIAGSKGADRKAQIGKKYKTTGKVFVTRIFNDKLLNFTFYTTIDGWLFIDRHVWLAENMADPYRKKIGANKRFEEEATVTVYLTVRPEGDEIAFWFDAVKRPDGKLVQL
jgi:hypothetical protein